MFLGTKQCLNGAEACKEAGSGFGGAGEKTTDGVAGDAFLCGF
jgi:hypothetical protein